MTPPEALRRAADLLEEAKEFAEAGDRSTSDRKLDAARRLVFNVLDGLDSMGDSIESAGAVIWKKPSR